MRFRLAALLPMALALQGLARAQAPLPYRFLLVIGDQWKDPSSYIIEDGGEFQIMAALLKSWGLPFDILRLDQQRLDQYHLLDRDGRPRYGTIIWDAGPGGLQDKGLALMPELVKRYGTGLVILGDTVAAPEISALAGVRYVSEFDSPDTLAATRMHFITRGLDGRERAFVPEDKYLPGNKTVVQDATVLMKRGPHPFLTVKEWNERITPQYLKSRYGSWHVSIRGPPLPYTASCDISVAP